MNLIYRFLDLFFPKRDLDRVLARFNRLDDELSQVLDWIDRRGWEISKAKSALRAELEQLDLENLGLLEQIEKASRVRDKIRDLVS